MTKFIRAGIALATIVSLAMLGARSAGAAASRNVFDVHVGDNFVPALAEPDVAVAENGNTFAARLTGVLDAEAKTASGSGTFEHRASDGTLIARGTLTVTGLTAFQSFGCGFAVGWALSPNFCGGRALLTVVAHPAPGVNVDTTVTVTCDVTDGSPPAAGHPEGITHDVPGHLNFNKSMSGHTLFVEHLP